jgi:hypothetical protein
MRIVSRLILGIAAALLATAACRPQPAPEAWATAAPPPAGEQAGEATTPVAPPLPPRQGLGPEQVTQTYYEWYIANTIARFEGLSDLDGVLQAEGYLAEALVERIVAERAAGLVADPILCAQDVPRSVRVIEATTEGSSASVLLGTSFEGQRLQVHLEEGAQGWQITQVTCRPGQPEGAAAAAPSVALAPLEPGWVQYHNQEYGFAILIPQDWAVEELVQDPHLPPIGPPSLRLAVYLTPPQPEGAASAPFAIEFAIGDEDELRDLYGAPTLQEPLEIGGLPAMREVEELGNDLAVVRYVLAHPRFPERRVTLLDPISGFPERRAQAEEALAQFDRVLASLRFVD